LYYCPMTVVQGGMQRIFGWDLYEKIFTPFPATAGLLGRTELQRQPFGLARYRPVSGLIYPERNRSATSRMADRLQRMSNFNVLARSPAAASLPLPVLSLPRDFLRDVKRHCQTCQSSLTRRPGHV